MEACKRTGPGKYSHRRHRATIRNYLALLLTGLASTGCGSAGAQDSETGRASSAEDLLQRFLDEAQTLQAEFEQELRGPDEQLVERATGSLALWRPNRFLWRYRDPIEQLVLADGNNLWIYDIELAQATVTPMTEILAATPAMLLSGDQAVLESFDTVENFSADEFSWIHLAPTETGSDFRSVLIGFENEDLSRLELIDGLDQTTSIRFSEIVINEELDPELFSFDPPDGVDVIGEPR